jgi:hypothetical protein
MPDDNDKPRGRRGKLLLQSAAITTSALMVWCNRTGGEEPMIYANPKGPTYDNVSDAEPEPPDAAEQTAPDPQAFATAPAPAPSGKSAEVASGGAPDAGAPDASAPDAKAPGTKPTGVGVLSPPKPRIYANPKGSLYEIPADEPLGEPAGVEPARRPGRGSKRG